VDIVPDGRLVSILSNGIDVESTRPEASSPEDFFDFWMVSEEFLGGDTFDGFRELRGGGVGDGLDEEVDMVFIGSYLDESYLVAFADFVTDGFEGLFRGIVQDLSSVLHRTDDVVEKKVLVMTFVDVFAHEYQYITSALAPASAGVVYPGAEPLRYFWNKTDTQGLYEESKTVRCSLCFCG